MAATLFSLPIEVSDNILSALEYEDVLQFRLTCRAARFLVSMDEVTRVRAIIRARLLNEEQDEHDRVQARYTNHERWARAIPNPSRTYWTNDSIANIHANHITRAEKLNCYACLKSLPRACFTKRQCRGSRSLGHKDGARRFCKKCGVSKGIWEKGTIIKEFGGAMIVCKVCGKLATPTDQHHKSARVCSCECAERSSSSSSSSQEEDGDAQQSPGDVGVDSEQEQHGPVSFSPNDDTTTTTTLPNTSEEGGINVSGASANASTTTTRATRCQRCWGTSHTERLADGDKGLRLCKSCEGADEQRKADPAAAPAGAVPVPAAGADPLHFQERRE